MRLKPKDLAIIARALECACVAMMGDYVGGNDAVTEKRMQDLAVHFEEKASEGRAFVLSPLNPTR